MLPIIVTLFFRVPFGSDRSYSGEICYSSSSRGASVSSTAIQSQISRRAQESEPLFRSIPDLKDNLNSSVNLNFSATDKVSMEPLCFYLYNEVKPHLTAADRSNNLSTPKNGEKSRNCGISQTSDFKNEPGFQSYRESNVVKTPQTLPQTPSPIGNGLIFIFGMF